MAKITEPTVDIQAYCKKVLGKKGRLSTAIAGFTPRQAQIDLAIEIARVIETRSILLAEAGTGTGKTFAYLTPALISGKKVVISTATKTLQDQLYAKDLPQLIRALGLSVHVQNLKGRANYLCKHRVEQFGVEGRFTEPKIAYEVTLIAKKLPKLILGEQNELPEIEESSGVWPYVTSTADNCLGNKCDFHGTCFLVNARKKALKAEVVIINHHLFFADSQLKEEGFGELLPGAEVVIFDEAHQLESIATHFQGQQLSSRQVLELIHDLIEEAGAAEALKSRLSRLEMEFEGLIIDFLHCIKDDRTVWQDISRDTQFKASWDTFNQILGELGSIVEQVSSDEPENLVKCISKLGTLTQLSQQFDNDAHEAVRWIERFRYSLTFHITPIRIAESFKQLMAKLNAAYIFTSATLAVAGNFACFANSLGLETSNTLLLASPFDYPQQALLYLPRDLPDPKHPHYYQALVAKVVPVINALEGRCFFLFTSHKALKEVAEILHNNLNYPLLIQGDEAKPILLARFRKMGNAVLLGTATFWEGVDVKGEALAGVIIDKLPFSSPMDPITKGKLAYFERKGLSSFFAYTLPEAILILKQGIGRLIRDKSDKGILVIADPRLTGRDYGREIFSSLPAIPKTRDEQRVLLFIQDNMAVQSNVLAVEQ